MYSKLFFENFDTNAKKFKQDLDKGSRLSFELIN